MQDIVEKARRWGGGLVGDKALFYETTPLPTKWLKNLATELGHIAEFVVVQLVDECNLFSGKVLKDALV